MNLARKLLHELFRELFNSDAIRARQLAWAKAKKEFQRVLWDQYLAEANFRQCQGWKTRIDSFNPTRRQDIEDATRRLSGFTGKARRTKNYGQTPLEDHSPWQQKALRDWEDLEQGETIGWCG